MGVVCEFDGVTRKVRVGFQTFDLVLYGSALDKIVARARYLQKLSILLHTNCAYVPFTELCSLLTLINVLGGE